MTDLPNTIPDSGPSVELEPTSSPQNPAGYKPDAEPEKKEEPKLSARQALEKAQADLTAKGDDKKPEQPKEAKEPKPELKAEEKPSRERAEDGKFKGKEAQIETQETSDSTSEAKEGEQVEAQDKRSSEGRGNREPPARLLPREREEWIKTPNVVRDGIKRLEQEYETELRESREAKENWSKLARFDEMAKARGVTIDRALEHYTGIDARLQQDLVGGLDHIARQYGVDLRQVAQHVLQQPADQYQAQIVQQANQIHGHNQQLQQHVSTLQEQLKAAQTKIVELETIQPFVGKVGAQRYKELEPYIANFLNSGMIPSSLSGQQKLEHAFAMAERLYGSSQAEGAVSEGRNETEAKRVNPAGQKSIRGNPGQVSTSRDQGKLSPRDAIKAAAREIGVNIQG